MSRPKRESCKCGTSPHPTIQPNTTKGGVEACWPNVCALEMAFSLSTNDCARIVSSLLTGDQKIFPVTIRGGRGAKYVIGARLSTKRNREVLILIEHAALFGTPGSPSTEKLRLPLSRRDFGHLLSAANAVLPSRESLEAHAFSGRFYGTATSDRSLVKGAAR